MTALMVEGAIPLLFAAGLVVPVEQWRRLEEVLTNICVPPDSLEEDDPRYVIQNDDGDSIVAADDVVSAVEQIVGCWHDHGEMLERRFSTMSEEIRVLRAQLAAQEEELRVLRSGT